MTDIQTENIEAAGVDVETASPPSKDADANIPVSRTLDADTLGRVDRDFRDFLRRNARWLMAELDWARSGRTEDERANLNP